MAKFSIIIPAYNLEEFLGDCLCSIQNQNFSDFEVLIIDDGSKDNTIQVAQEFVSKDNRFVLITKENGGVSSARNLGLKHAKGEFVWFIDGDDYIHPNSLRWINSMFSSAENIDFLNFRYAVTNKRFDGQFVDSFITNDEIQCFDCRKDDEFNLALIDGLHSICQVCFRKNISGNITFQNIRLNEDLLFTLSLLTHSRRVIYTKVKPYYYYQRAGSSSKQITFSQFKDLLVYIDISIEMDKNELVRGNGYMLSHLCREHIPSTMHYIVRLPLYRERRDAFKLLCQKILQMDELLLIPKEYFHLLSIARSRCYLKGYVFLYLRYMPRKIIVKYPYLVKKYQVIKLWLGAK